ncbi:Transcriptional regulator, MerR family [Pseudomonas chlororaphis subsp. piscium]|uniref:MerR family transcriptional regulator n=1 Tax=Pseudomonas chlororaphis TaxID=587753 RepID=UPI000F58655E|nr:GyrI-like domain-containing protein [Pseudomonas chlororaphis]AZC91777.1 Transcriptional regulator, MerR family [Pseudomonas chlororaphis subsp. piscium]
MLTIGQMARCHGLTTKTLRHYDSIGLFTPALTGQDNGYRYYKPEQIGTLGRIVWLRQLGMGLEEIRGLADSGALHSVLSLRQALQAHAGELEAQIARSQNVLGQLQRYLAQPERSLPAPQTPVRVTLAAQRIIGMAWQQDDQGSIAELWQRFEPREQEIQRLAEPVGTYGICQPLSDGQWRYVAGLPVSAEAPLVGGMVELEIPARQYARVEHRGTVQTLPETFRAAYSEWLPAAGMRADEGVEFEYTGERFFGPMHPDSVVELYIPLKN